VGFYYDGGGLSGYRGYGDSSQLSAGTVSFFVFRVVAESGERMAESVYCINSAGRPVRRSMRFAIGGWVENRLPKFIPRNG
jgi:hypothetical protein